MGLTSRIQALTAYANEVTGESDTTLSDAVATLAEGYGSGGGSGGLTLLDTVTFSDVRGQRVNINSTWYSTYTLILIVPSITLSASDWIYFNTTGENSGGSYFAVSALTFDSDFSSIGSSGRFATLRSTGNSPVPSDNFIYYYTYTASKTMSGKFDIYGITL